VKEAVLTYTNSEGTVKAGLKSQLYYLIKRFAKIIKATYFVRDDDEKAGEVDNFVQVLQLHESDLFGDATYKRNMNRQEKLRRPTQLPDEADIGRVKQYTVTRMSEIVSDEYTCDHRSFAELHDLAVSRLTLFNARKGGEPARLTVSHWLDAEHNSWLTQSQASDDIDQNYFHDMKVTFQGGKGNNQSHWTHVRVFCVNFDRVATCEVP